MACCLGMSGGGGGCSSGGCCFLLMDLGRGSIADCSTMCAGGTPCECKKEKFKFAPNDNTTPAYFSNSIVTRREMAVFMADHEN